MQKRRAVLKCHARLVGPCRLTNGSGQCTRYASCTGGGLNPRFHLDSLVSPLRSYLTVVCGLSVVRHIEKTGSRTIAVAHSGTETFRFKL